MPPPIPSSLPILPRDVDSENDTGVPVGLIAGCVTLSAGILFLLIVVIYPCIKRRRRQNAAPKSSKVETSEFSGKAEREAYQSHRQSNSLDPLLDEPLQPLHPNYQAPHVSMQQTTLGWEATYGYEDTNPFTNPNPFDHELGPLPHSNAYSSRSSRSSTSSTTPQHHSKDLPPLTIPTSAPAIVSSSSNHPYTQSQETRNASDASLSAPPSAVSDVSSDSAYSLASASTRMRHAMDDLNHDPSTAPPVPALPPAFRLPLPLDLPPFPFLHAPNANAHSPAEDAPEINRSNAKVISHLLKSRAQRTAAERRKDEALSRAASRVSRIERADSIKSGWSTPVSGLSPSADNNPYGDALGGSNASSSSSINTVGRVRSSKKKGTAIPPLLPMETLTEAPNSSASSVFPINQPQIPHTPHPHIPYTPETPDSEGSLYSPELRVELNPATVSFYTSPQEADSGVRT